MKQLHSFFAISNCGQVISALLMILLLSCLFNATSMCYPVASKVVLKWKMVVPEEKNAAVDRISCSLRLPIGVNSFAKEAGCC
jgi:hypothetical protein